MVAADARAFHYASIQHSITLISLSNVSQLSFYNMLVQYNKLTSQCNDESCERGDEVSYLLNPDSGQAFKKKVH